MGRFSWEASELTTTDPAPAPAPPRGFPISEFEARSERAQRLMAARGLDALLVTTEPDLRYFSGFQSQFWESPTRPWFLIVPRDGRPIAVIPEIGAAGMQATWVEDIRTWPAPRPEDDGVSLLAATLAEQATRFGRIGVPLGHETHLRMPAGDYARLAERLGNLEIADATDVVRQLRNIKSAAELAKIRYACQVTSLAYQALPSRARIGETEREVCRRLRIDLLQRGADTSPYLIAASGPGGYDNIIMGPTERVLGPGDVLIIDTGTTYDGYFCDFDRNFAFGLPSDAAGRDHVRPLGRHVGGPRGGRRARRERRPARPWIGHAVDRGTVQQAGRRHPARTRHGDHHRARHGVRARQAHGARGEHRDHGRRARAPGPPRAAGDADYLMNRGIS